MTIPTPFTGSNGESGSASALHSTGSDNRTSVHQHGEADDLERLALGTLLPAFEGVRMPGWIETALRNGLAGVTLFGPNIVSDDQLRALTAELRETGNPLICLDEEGGDVTRISYRSGSRYPGNAALGVVNDTELTRTVYHAIGADLTRLGVNLNLAPCGDVNTEDENPVIGTRAFGTDPKLVARHTSAAIRGLQDAGVAACVKHFPGHGATRQDSHQVIPVVDADLGLLRARELPPFRAAIDAGCAAVMTAHVRVPALTGDQPATLSTAAMRDLIRRELGFDGVVITDALDMKAITESVGLTEGAVRSLDAGSDLLCLGPIPDEHDVAAIIDAIVGAVQHGRLSRARLEESSARVARLRQWLAGCETQPSSDQEIGIQAARRALRADGQPSITGDPAATVLLELQSPPTIAVGEVPWGLSAIADELPSSVLRLDPSTSIVDTELSRLVDGRRPVVAVRDAHRNPAARDLVERLMRLRPETILIEMGLPIWRPTAGRSAYLASYGASRANARAAVEHLGLLPS